MPDLAILDHLRRLRPYIKVTFYSYGTGADVFLRARENVADMGLREDCSFLDVLVAAGTLLVGSKACLIVSHEEPAVLPLARILGLRVLFLVHWFAPPDALAANALTFADKIMFMERPGLYQAPPGLGSKITYVGPVLRQFTCHPRDRERIRSELGLDHDEKAILVTPGSWPEDVAPAANLILNAFSYLAWPKKRLIWLAGNDSGAVASLAKGLEKVDVLGPQPWIEHWMIAADVAITKGTYNFGKELQAVGTPSVSLSHGLNPVDDELARTIATNTFLWVSDTTARCLADALETSLRKERPVPDVSLLRGTGAALIAEEIGRMLDALRS